MRTSTAIGVGVLTVGVGVAAIVVVTQPMAADEEAPIVVKNGTLDIVAGVDKDNEWTFEAEPKDSEDDTPSYSYEPKNKYLDGSKVHFVKISMQTGSCIPNQLTASGKVVRVEYTYDTGGGSQKKEFTLKRGKSGLVNYRTKIRPPGDLSPGTDSDTGRPKLYFNLNGYISAVRVGDWSCTFQDKDAKPELTVCSSDKRKECQ
jgi:hypothetical protein